MATNQQNGHEALRARFSDAARGVAELYCDALHSYNAGYRDALLHLHRFVLTAARNSGPVGASSVKCPSATLGGGNGCIPSGLGDCTTTSSVFTAIGETPLLLDAGEVLGFIQRTLKCCDSFASPRTIAKERKRLRSGADHSPNLHCLDDFAANTTPANDMEFFCVPNRTLTRRRLDSPRRILEDVNGTPLPGEVHIIQQQESDSVVSDDDLTPGP
ncbi:hypothetical protein ERJ75_000352000 [Trypanosoma vivax]|uniref:Uncharacterized protein n=1 Tax=Trypanosoma vivax (strain Y486) TaxID=1055687 RepID=G0TZN6_TRYVY|nr:hypothetical protein TRVL_04744 [Trypanosoma vivax]KAH8617668.1 hypothetical protein ERJ75_000352000 [Trypanosoma vivax]CCC50064.1 conserved hypothetical protein [Trypanosoma vivax Y486]